MVQEYSGSPMSDPKSHLTVGQVNSIIDSCRRPRDKLLFFTLAMTGRRVSEVVRSLRPSDIDFERGLINWTILKRRNFTQKLLPANPKLLGILERYIARNRIPSDQAVFPMSRQYVDRLFKAAAARAGIEEVGTGLHNKPHVHLLRHTFAIRGAERAQSPADLVQLKELLGHSRMDTTMFYLKFNPQEQRRMLDKMWAEDEDQ